MEQDQNSGVNHNVALLLTDRLKEAWRNFMEEFQQTFDLNQLDSVLSLLRELDSTSQSSTKKKRLEFMQKEDGESENDNDNSSSTLEKKVFGNHLVAKSIFKNLSNSDLFSCRLMNSYWNENATEVLLKRDFKITFRRNINRFYLNKSNWKSLDMFTEFLKQSKHFPCNKFVFRGGNLGNDDAQRFFNFYGSSIKNIKISFSDGHVYNKDDPMDNEKAFSPHLTESRVIGMILSQQLPNLEHLVLDLTFQGDYEWTGLESLVFPPETQVKLPNLKKLVSDYRGDGDDPLLRQLLLAATNLERFEFTNSVFQLDSLDNFTKTGKVKCIADLWFPTQAEELDKLEEMVKYEPKLTDLYLEYLIEFCNQPETWKRISIILTKLLESCKNSLNQIHDFGSHGFLRQLQLPLLPNVRHLDMYVLGKSIIDSEHINDYSFAFLPRGATFTRNFPQLDSVQISFDSEEISSTDTAAWWSKYFPTDEIVPTVRKLKVCDHRPVFWIQKLSSKFPNIETLSITNIKDFPGVSKIIWTQYKKLTSLELFIDLSSPLNSYLALDSSFTGLSPEVCNLLGELSTSELESVAENCMGNEPSLLNLTDLQSLQIGLHFPMEFENYNYPPILTILSGICVFKPLKSLQQVTIQYSTHFKPGFNQSLIRQNLEPLIPYKVKIENDQ